MGKTLRNEQIKGKTYEEIYGNDKAQELRNKLKKVWIEKYSQGYCSPKKGIKLSKELLEKNRQSHIGIKQSEETKIKKKLIMKEIWKNKEYRMRVTKMWNNEDSKKRMIEIRRNQWTDELREKMSKSSKRIWNNPEHKRKQIKCILNGLMSRPTSFELKIIDIVEKNKLPYIYVGNGDYLINYKNPDFIDEDNKVAIEVFYSFYKQKDYGSVENYKELCIKQYNQEGWKVLFFDENDVLSNQFEKIFMEKINDNPNV